MNSTSAAALDWAEVQAETAALLSRYLRINTTNPPGDELRAAEFLADCLREAGIEPEIFVSAPGRGNLVARLKGSGVAGPILLYHHMDVVPADPATWTTNPFSGQVRDGYVYGRGALDIKGQGALHVMALRLLYERQVPLKRDVILFAGADEEMAGAFGAKWMLDHHLDAVRAEIVWDEGGYGLTGFVPDRPIFSIAVAEKASLGIRLVAHGTPGHASVPHGDNPVERLVRAVERLLRRTAPARLTPALAESLRRLAPTRTPLEAWLLRRAGNALVWPLVERGLSDPLFHAMLHNTLSVTMLDAGYKGNLIPEQASAHLDIRLLPDEDPKAFVAGLQETIDDARVECQVLEWPVSTPASPAGGPLFESLDAVLPRLAPRALLLPFLTPGATDSRFFRLAGMASYGLTPIQVDREELARIHGIDERISLQNLGLGVRTIYEVLLRLAAAEASA